MTPTIAPETFQPESKATAEDLGQFLDQYESLRLMAPDGTAVALPRELQRLLTAVVHGMAHDRAITVSPTSRTMTTTEAASLLGVSRPTVVKLIDAGELPADRTGHRRKIAIEDLMAYRKKRRQEQYRILASIAVDPFGDDDVPTAEELKAARREVASARRARS